MTKVIAKIDFVANDIPYIEGDEIKGLSYDQIVKLNEAGFIQPLTLKDLVLLKRELENKIEKEEL